MRPVYAAAKTAGTIAETVMRLELSRRLGVEWGELGTCLFHDFSLFVFVALFCLWAVCGHPAVHPNWVSGRCPRATCLS